VEGTSLSYRGHRYPVEVISHCVWLYFRFPLSFREVAVVGSHGLDDGRDRASKRAAVGRWPARYGDREVLYRGG
jgi:putative transposase